MLKLLKIKKKKNFDKTVGKQGINRNLECVRELFNKNRVLTSTEKYVSQPSIKSIKVTMNGTNSNFSFKFVNQDHIFYKVNVIDGNKASKRSDIPNKIIKQNINIVSCILHHYFNNSLFDSFQVN